MGPGPSQPRPFPGADESSMRWRAPLRLRMQTMAFRVLWTVGRAALGIYFRLQIRHHDAAPKAGARIYAPNHISYLDPIVTQMLTREPACFMMTTEYYYRRWGKWFFRWMGCIPVEIGRGMARAEATRRAIRELRRGRCLVLFPEGRVSPNGQLQEAEPGLGAIARITSAPVIPVAVRGTFEAWPKGGSWIKPRRIIVTEGAPLRFTRGRTGIPNSVKDKIFVARWAQAVRSLQELDDA